ncbi:4'-phosphopantetheinyl transferase family protein [Nonomuraea aurantiaca]|uniref:4'-phosphopantetheinyl transferase family protein n=1 Tax=Nonomuraea aurantiaca TaxID=2878562 RepID=UPI001CD9D8ED|nr:4'-phosphopantetheinyl transferase superfamily protein [Nonomuraea aurantiaca]MCA2220999.1 4'-phosphopantetheinyl transferase superfamily protein [Nonomuraea aurantiaca]
MTQPRVWKIHLDRPLAPGGWRSLSDAERERARRLGSARERHRFMVAHAALRAILGEVCGVRAARLAFGAEDSGRPYVALPYGRTAPGFNLPDGRSGNSSHGRGAPDFNLSHSEEWALVAVAPPGSRVGVDVERIREDLDCLAMAGSMYQPEEVDRLREAGPSGLRAGYFRLWTAKEAYVKAVGVGLAGLRNVLVREESTTHGAVLSLPSPPGAALPVRWLGVAPGYAAAVVTATAAS